MIAIMQEAYPDLSIRRLCALSGTGRTWSDIHPSADDIATRETALCAASEAIALEVPGYGDRWITAALRRDGWVVTHKRVRRVMRDESLLCQVLRRFVGTTEARHGLRAYPHLAATASLTGPDQRWVSDRTSIRLPTTFISLAAILDAWSRRGIGWHLARTIETALPLAARKGALAARQPSPGLIHHSDRGVQYASVAYTARLGAVGAQISMSATGDPSDTATAESVFTTLKCEEVSLQHDQSVAEAEASLERFIEDVYNAKRLHSGLGYRPPIEFEVMHAGN